MDFSERALDRSSRARHFAPVSRREFLRTATAAGVVIAAPAEERKDSPPRQVATLNGTWSICFDQDGRWKKSDWINDFLAAPARPVTIPWDSMRASMESHATQIRVPATWEEYRPGTEGEAWYWREISIPEAEGPRAVRVRFGAVRYGAEVFLDGRRVALYLGGFTPFVADLTPFVKPGSRHQLAVHVVNPGGGEAGIWQTLFFENVQIPQSHNFGGIWQDVALISTPPIYVEDIFVEPQIARKAALVHVTVRNLTGQPQPVQLGVRALLRDASGREAGKAGQSIQVPAGEETVIALPMALNPLELWEPARPIRYRLEAGLRGSASDSADEFTVDFGLREFAVRGRFFYLNGRKFMVKSTINHQYYPLTVGYPPTPEFARKEIEVAQKAGLNMMHIHRQVGHPQLLEWADELGLLLYQEPGGVIFNQSRHLDSPGIRLLLRQLQDLVRRDRNHPALVAWGMSNENVLDDAVVSHMMRQTRQLDSTRVVCDNSGAGRKFLPPYEQAFQPWRDFHFYPPAPIEGGTYAGLAKAGTPPNYTFEISGSVVAPPMHEEGPQIVGEFGYGGLPDIPATVREFAATGKPSVEGDNWKQSLAALEAGFRKYGLDKVLAGVSEFCRLTEDVHSVAQAEMLQALRTNPVNSGYAVSCFHDLAIWYCGLTNVFRDPKPISGRLAQVNTPLFLALHAEPAPARVHAEVRVECVVVNEGVVHGPARLRVSVSNPEGRAIFDRTLSLDLDPQKQFVVPAFDAPVRVEGGTGHYTIHAELESGGALKSHNERRVFALDPADIRWPSDGVVVYDPNHRLLPFLAPHRIRYEIWSPGLAIQGRPILVAEMDRWYYYEHRQISLEDIRRILDQCRQGARASFFLASADGGLIDALNQLDVSPQPWRLVGTRGNFQGCFHFVKPHPLFDTLPSRCCMNNEYRNVIARISLDGFEGESVVVCNENTSWWGTDVGIVRLGQGAALLTTLRVVENLEKDPVAERILANILRWKRS